GDPTQRARQQSGLLTRRCSAALLAAEDATAERIDGEKGTRGEGPTHEQGAPLGQAPLPQSSDERAPQTDRLALPERLLVVAGADGAHRERDRRVRDRPHPAFYS